MPLHRGQCVSLPGYALFMLNNLQCSRATRVGENDIIALGCPRGAPQWILNQCLARIRNFTQVPNKVLEAEFPNYDLKRAFCICNLPTSGGGLTLRNTADDTPEEVSRAFRQLAQAFNVDMPNLVARYNDHLSTAHRVHIVLTNCSQPRGLGQGAAQNAALFKVVTPCWSAHPGLAT